MEMWQPGKVLDKLSNNHTYLEVKNYWTPLDTIEEEEENKEEVNNTMQNATATTRIYGNKWTRRLEWQKMKQNEHSIIINSGATSHFVSKEANLPNMGKANAEVYLPDGSTLTATNKTLLPFEQMSKASQ